MPVNNMWRVVLAVGLCWGGVSSVAADVVDPAVTSAAASSALPAASEVVRVPDEFEVVEFAGDELAHDIFCMTLDAQGRVVVAGPGYVRILIDADGDGRAERAIQFADGPKNGAQGLFFRGRTLLAIGDEGLLRYRDQDGDDRADGPPDVLLRLKTGGEHDTHSIQQGPDGWWYVIVGNHGGVSQKFATLPTSPVKVPRAGALLRFTPDLSGGEIIADGLRNAYDFTFNAHGDLFTFDSDDERDISLPWYRPTRVFHVLPGSDHGWVSQSWKRPDYSFEMPPVVGSFGRGSPTGVACYRHTQFPLQYHGATFALDWTYGRVLCLKPAKMGATWSANSEVFMSGRGGNGFAPTDCEVGPDGELYVSVGGRGTRGAVYRIRHRIQHAAVEKTPTDAPLDALSVLNQEDLARTLHSADSLDRILQAPQPLASWSRAQWMPLARQLDRQKFVEAVFSKSRPAPERIRALEVLTELHQGLDATQIHLLTATEPAEVRARAIWSYGRIAGAKVDPLILATYLQDSDPAVVRAALEVAFGYPPTANWQPLVKPLATALGHEDRFIRALSAQIVARMPQSLLPEMSQAATSVGARSVVSYAAGWISLVGEDLSRVRAAMSPILVAILQNPFPTELKLDSLRLLQRMLGDLGPSERHAPAFDGYAPGVDPEMLERDWDELRIQLAEIYPTQNLEVDTELSRVLAMLAPSNQKLLDRLLASISLESDPVSDIHQLLVIARLPVPRSTEQRQRIAEALVRLDVKFTQRKLPQDSNWNDRVADLYKVLAAQDEFLPPVMVDVPEFGRPGHVLFMSEMPGRRLVDAIAAFSRQIAADADYPWTNDVIFLLGASELPEHRELVRQQLSRFQVQGAVLMTLSERPDTSDRAAYIEGLETSQLEVLQACVAALTQLPPSGDAAEQLVLLKVLRRLGQEKGEYPVREQVVQLLQRNTGHVVPFIFGDAGYHAQPEAVQGWTNWCLQQWPSETAIALGGTATDIEQLRKSLEEVDWNAGDVARGGQLFQTRACAQCHGGRSALGPDLSGVAARFSREDLFLAIVQPSRDVSARYQTTVIQTANGQTYSGLIVYESTDGLLLRNGSHQTFRIETADIEERRRSAISLMPQGLLKDLRPGDYADLYAYLMSISPGADRGTSTTAGVRTKD